MSENAKWYVVHTYSGYEKTVSDAIMKSSENRQMQDLIFETNIPEEEVVEHTDNGDKITRRKIFPGYVLVKMIMTDESWYLVRNSRGCTGFVSSDGKPVPLTEQEILSLGVERREINLGFKEGDSVRIIDGPFNSYTGTVDEIDAEKNSVRLIISMFGRETPIDLDIDQVEPVNED